MNIRPLLIGLVGFFLVLGCKETTKIKGPAELYSVSMENTRSLLNIPVELNVKSLEASLNDELQGVLFEDRNFDDGDRMQLKAVKAGQITFKAGAQDIAYSLPLSLTMRYNTSFGILDAAGDIALDLKTSYLIQPDWSIQTQTEIVSHKWLKKPILQVGSLNVPIGFVIDAVLKNTRKALGKEIDEIVGETLGLNRVVADTWDMLYQPLLLEPQYSAWLQVNPTSIGMTPITLHQNILSATVIVEAKPLVSIGPRPVDRKPDPLPPFTQYNATTPGFNLVINTSINWEEAERIAKKQMLGEVYSAGKRKVKVEDLNLYGNADKVVIDTKLSGSYNGSIFLTGKPEYDAFTNRISIRQLDYTLDTKNFLVKSGGWLLRTTIKNRIQDNLNFLLSYNLSEMKNMLQSELNMYKLAPGLRMEGLMKDLRIGSIILTKEGIQVGVQLEGNLKIMVAK
jgi:hypothetical protein